LGENVFFETASQLKNLFFYDNGVKYEIKNVHGRTPLRPQA